jgi:hypothetical protein
VETILVQFGYALQGDPDRGYYSSYLPPHGGLPFVQLGRRSWRAVDQGTLRTVAAGDSSASLVRYMLRLGLIRHDLGNGKEPTAP